MDEAKLREAYNDESLHRQRSMTERRRSSLSSGLVTLSRSMSAGLTFVQKKVGKVDCLEFSECKNCKIDIENMEKAFIKLFDDRSIQLSNMKMKRNKRKDDSYDIVVYTKGILRVSGRRRVGLNVRLIKNWKNTSDREFLVYTKVIDKVKEFISKKYTIHSKFLPISESVDINKYQSANVCGDMIFMLEDKNHMGFKRDLLQNCEGLDYEHSVLVISALARFHATTYCYYQADNETENFLGGRNQNKKICLPTLSKETIEEINKLLKSNPEFQKYSHFFLGQIQEKEADEETKMFGVLCHGNCCRENLLFKYKSNLESRLSCCDVCFQDLSRSHYGSCVMDLYQFIFTSIDLDARKRFLADFVFSVYYESFAKTVGNINNDISMFSLNDFIREFKDKIFYGFAFAAEIHTWMVKEACKDVTNQQERYLADIKYEKYMLALLEDIVKFINQADVTIIN